MASSMSQFHESWFGDPLIDDVFSMNKDTIVAKVNNKQLYARALHTLEPGTWLATDAVCLYMEMITETAMVYPFLKTQLEKTNPLILAKSKTGQRVEKELKNKRWIAVPICDNVHWTLMMFNIEKKEFYYLNSLDSEVELSKIEIRVFFSKSFRLHF